MLLWLDGRGRGRGSASILWMALEIISAYLAPGCHKLEREVGDLCKFGRTSSALFPQEEITASFRHVVKHHSSVIRLSVSLSSPQRGNLVTSWLDNLTQRAGERMKGGGEGTEERREGNAAY